MNFQDFLNYFTNILASQVPNDCTPTIQTITKNNGIVYHAIALTNQSTCEAPLIYMDSYYQSFCEGVALEQLVCDFLEATQHCMSFGDSFPDMPQDFEQMKPFIFVKAVHYERNLPWLTTIPHRRVLDLAMIYEFVIPHSMDGYGFSVITNDVIRSLKMSEAELHELAWQNMRRENTPQTITINCLNSIHLLTNRKKAHGAAYIFDRNLLQKFADFFECDLYIIPSSIHEIMIVPWNDFASKEELDAMVCEVNETAVDPEEHLSDHVYVFKRETGILTL